MPALQKVPAANPHTLHHDQVARTSCSPNLREGGVHEWGVTATAKQKLHMLPHSIADHRMSRSHHVQPQSDSAPLQPVSTSTDVHGQALNASP